ncbi:MAG: outer membrane beta-barrel protein [Gammaproteobacteria bacterium]
MLSLTSRPVPAFPTLLVLVSLLLSTPARSAEMELYGGIGLGYSTFSVDDINFEGTSLANRQFIGFNYGDYVGVELTYIDFGTVNDRVSLVPGEPSINDGIETQGYDFSVVGRYPLNDELSAFGKLGVIRWDSEVTLETFPLPTKFDGDDLTWGIGLDFIGSGPVRVRVEGDFVNIDLADSWWVLNASIIYAFKFGR